LVLIK